MPPAAFAALGPSAPTALPGGRVRARLARGVVMNDVYLHYLRGLRGEDVVQELDSVIRRCTQPAAANVATSVMTNREGRMPRTIAAPREPSPEHCRFPSFPDAPVS